MAPIQFQVETRRPEIIISYVNNNFLCKINLNGTYPVTGRDALRRNDNSLCK